MNSSAFLKVCDCAILTSPASLYYLSGMNQSDATILIRHEGMEYITSPLYEVEAKASLSKDLCLKVLPPKEQDAYIRSCLSEDMTIGLEEDHLSVSRMRSILRGLNPRTCDIGSILENCRIVKRTDEIEKISRAEWIVDQAYAAVLPTIREGITERQVASDLLFRMLALGADGLAFDTIVAFGENAAKPHAVPSDRALRQGDCIVMDFGAKVDGYCSDFTRTLHLGAPTKRFRQAYDLVLSAQKAALNYIENGGRDAAEADRIAREIIDNSPFRGAFNHTLGHGVGIEIHERPYLRQKASDLLKDGQVFTVEPGIYVEGEFGIRIESLAVLEDGKLTVLDRSDKENYIV